jgi:hypothetical protein
VEILAGGYYEPILAIWPHDHQVAQVTRLRDKVEELFGVRRAGCGWPSACGNRTGPMLADCGIEYTFVDNTVFQSAGIEETRSFGSYETAGAPLRVFPINEPLRYHIPWREPEEAITYLRSIHDTAAPDALAIFADDGEKFGAWPGTYDFIFTRGWLERFFTTLEENADWLQTVTAHEYSQQHAPLARVKLPAGSYPEMQQWSSGNWRNFLSRYTESHDMYEEVLRAGERVQSAADAGGAPNEQAFDHVLRAQANDAYWHGVFGDCICAIYARRSMQRRPRPRSRWTEQRRLHVAKPPPRAMCCSKRSHKNSPCAHTAATPFYGRSKRAPQSGFDAAPLPRNLTHPMCCRSIGTRAGCCTITSSARELRRELCRRQFSGTGRFL